MPTTAICPRPPAAAMRPMANHETAMPRNRPGGYARTTADDGPGTSSCTGSDLRSACDRALCGGAATAMAFVEAGVGITVMPRLSYDTTRADSHSVAVATVIDPTLAPSR